MLPVGEEAAAGQAVSPPEMEMLGIFKCSLQYL